MNLITDLTFGFELLYAHQYLPPFFTVVYIVERLILQTIYVLNKEILQFFGLISTVYNQERFQIKSGL